MSEGGLTYADFCRIHDEVIAAHRPCWECTKRDPTWPRGGGVAHFGVVETLRDANGNCTGCGTATTPEQEAQLSAKIAESRDGHHE